MTTPEIITQAGSDIGTSEALSEDQSTGANAGGGAADGALDPEEAAMLAGYQSVSSDGEDADDAAATTTDKTKPEGTTTGDGDAGGTGDAGGEGANAGAAVDEEQEIPGLGKPSEIRARLEAAGRLQEQLAGLNGHVGHLKSLIQTAGKGRPITKAQLGKVSNEFGEEFASALADDLSAAGFGGAVVDESVIERVTQGLVEKATAATEQKLERKFVAQVHPDAADFFAGGKEHNAFMAFVQALPAERQQLVLNSWDSAVINPVLSDFKAQRDKTANAQVRQTSRVARAVAPTVGRNASATQPEVDPMEAGFNSVAKNRMKPAQMGRRA